MNCDRLSDITDRLQEALVQGERVQGEAAKYELTVCPSQFHGWLPRTQEFMPLSLATSSGANAQPCGALVRALY